MSVGVLIAYGSHGALTRSTLPSDFSNILSKSAIERLADVDEYEVVREVQVSCTTQILSLYSLNPVLKEYFADYAPILPSLFSLNHTPTTSWPLYGSSANTWEPKALDRSVQGVLAVLLSLKKKPVIRYEKSSPMAKKLGVEIQVQHVGRLFKGRDLTLNLASNSIRVVAI